MQRVLITGGNKGIGLEITKLFCENNFDVLVLARDFSTFPKELKTKTKQITFDLSKTADIPKIAEKIGDIDILINNAGVMNSLQYDNYSENKKESLVAINLEAPIALITEFSKNMIKKKRGRIVSMASIAGEIGHPDIWYGVTKAGVINFTKSFAKILGEKGVVINCVAPSIVEGTNMFRVIPEERKKDQINRVLTHEFVQPNAVAQTVYWLATESPVYINGNCIDINNGVLMR